MECKFIKHRHDTENNNNFYDFLWNKKISYTAMVYKYSNYCIINRNVKISSIQHDIMKKYISEHKCDKTCEKFIPECNY